MSHLLSPVATSLDHSARYVCPVSTRMPLNPYVCFRVALAVEITGRKATWTQEYHSRRSRMLHVAHKHAVSSFEEAAKAWWMFFMNWPGWCAHMCLSGFDRLDTLFAKNRCTRSTPTGVRGIVHLSQVSSTLKTNKDLDPIYVLVFLIV